VTCPLTCTGVAAKTRRVHVSVVVVRFARVLPLPSDNWLGGCGEWFCHGEPDGATGRALSVRAGDCLVGDTCIMLAATERLQGVITRLPTHNPLAKASAQACPTACSPPNPATVKCKRCSAELGTVQKVEKQGNGLYKGKRRETRVYISKSQKWLLPSPVQFTGGLICL
jgi:hypothetical protein